MGIVAFDVRKDEIPYFRKYSTIFGLDIMMVKESLTSDNIGKIVDGDSISIIGHSKINAQILTSLSKKNVRHISTRTVGINHIDVEAAQHLNIKITNSYYGPDCVAEFTIMLILMSLRKYKAAMFRGNINDYSLEGLKGKELSACTVGIIGTGAIGTAVMHILHGFKTKILAYSPTGKEKEELKSYVEYVDLDTLYEQSDIISLHIPYLPDTKHLINIVALDKMKKGVMLVNTSRGELMDISSIIHAIETQKIGALALDVFESEQDIYHHDRKLDIISNRDMAYLRQFPNVVMTQHMAFYTENAVESMVKYSLQSFISNTCNQS